MNFAGGVVKSARFTQAWGASPGSGTLEVLGKMEVNVSVAVAFTLGSVTINGVVKKAEKKEQGEGGRLWDITVADNRELLSWDHLECMFNMVEIVEEKVDQPGVHRSKRYYSVYPDDWKALKRTYTTDKKGKARALTAKEILDAIFKAKGIRYDFTFEDHKNLAKAPQAVDAQNGKEVSALVQEVLDKVGLLMTIKGMNLSFCVKGEGQEPEKKEYSESITTGEALSNNATQVRIIGDRNLYQDLPVKLNPSWNRKWEDFVFEPDWLEAVEKHFGPYASDMVGRAERVLKSRQVTVREFCAKKKGKGFEDFGKWGEVSRMEIPAWVYLQEIVWKAYEIDRAFKLNGLDLFSLELKEGLLRAVTFDVKGKLSYAKPEELYPDTKAFIIMKGQPIDLTDPSKTDVLDPKQFEHLKELWWSANRFHLDPKNYAVIFEDPIFVPTCKKGGGGGSSSGSNSHSGGGGSNSQDSESQSGSQHTGQELARLLDPATPEFEGVDSAGGESGGDGSGNGAGGNGESAGWSTGLGSSYGGNGRAGKAKNNCSLFIYPNQALPASHPARNIVVPNADAEFQPAEIRGSFCFAGEKFSKEFGAGHKHGAVSVPGIGYHALMEEGAWKEEVKYADDEGAEKKAKDAAEAYTDKQQTYKDGGLVNKGVCATELNGAIDRATYSLSTRGLEETLEYAKERAPSNFENERELERQKEQGELFPGQRAERQEVDELSYWARILKAMKQGQQAKPYLNLNDILLKPPGAIHCSPTVVYPSKPVNAGDCIFKDGQKVDDKGDAFVGVVTCKISSKMAVPVATQGIVPVRISGPVEAGDAVGCEPGTRVATAATPSTRPVGVVTMSYDGKHGEVLLPTRLGAAGPMARTPYEVLPVLDKKGKVTKLKVWKESFLLVSANKKAYTQTISGLGKSFSVGKKGDKIYMRLKVTDDNSTDNVDQFAVPSQAKIMHGPAWTHFPDPIEIKQGKSKDRWDKNSKQSYFYQIIAELVDVDDSRPGFVIPEKKAKVVQLLFTNLMATPAFTTKQAYEPFLPVLVCVPWLNPGTKDGKPVPKAKSGDLMTPWSFGLGLPIPGDIKRAYMVVWEKSKYWKVLEAPKKGQYLPVVTNSSWGWIKTKKCKKKG